MPCALPMVKREGEIVMAKNWSPNQIALIGAQASRFPSKEATGGVMHWDSLRSTPEKVRAHMHALEAGFSADEQETLRNQFFANTAPGKEAAEIEAALGVCGGAVRSAEAMICERAQIKPDGSDNLT